MSGHFGSRKAIDILDRAILNVLYKAGRGLSGSFIAGKVNLSSPAIKPRLVNLEYLGIIKKVSVGKNRVFRRYFSGSDKLRRVVSPSKILWGLDIKQTKGNRKLKRC